MLIGLGSDTPAWLDALAAGTAPAPPAGSPAANALVGSATPNPAPTAQSRLRSGLGPERASNVSTSTAAVALLPSNPIPAPAAPTAEDVTADLLTSGYTQTSSGVYVLPAAHVSGGNPAVTADLMVSGFNSAAMGTGFGILRAAGYTASVNASGDLVIAAPGASVATAYPFGLTGTQMLLLAGAAALLLYFVFMRKGGR